MQVERIIEKPHTRSNGHDASETLQESLHLPDRLPLLVWLREWFKKGWLLVAPLKQEGKYAISQPLALVILGVLGSAFFVYDSGKSDTAQKQHDEIIVLRTQLAAEEKRNAAQDIEIGVARATAQIADKNSARLEGKFDQFALQYATSPKKAPVQIQE